jgi:hypothetical protein
MASLRNRTSTSDGHIIITGTGRAGTTFLVQLFTALGFSTGFSLEEALSRVDEISKAGLEVELGDEQKPYVIKSPWFADHLSESLRAGRIDIHAAIIPIRDLYEAAESRRRVYREAERRGLNPLTHPGTLWHTNEPHKQEEKLALQFYKAVFPLIQFEIPTFFVEFPRLVRDPPYLFKSIAPLMEDHGVNFSEYIGAHKKVADPDIVHTF